MLGFRSFCNEKASGAALIYQDRQTIDVIHMIKCSLKQVHEESTLSTLSHT